MVIKKIEKTFSSSEFIHGLLISYPTVQRWHAEGMWVLRQTPWIMTDESLNWVIANKPDKADLAKKMLEG